MKRLNDKDMDMIGKVLLVIFCFLMLMFSIESNAQTYTVNKINDRFIINFEDEFIDNHYFQGERITYYGKLDLSEEEYKQLIKDIKKTLKYDEYELDRDKYSVLNYGWVKDTVWVYYDEKAFNVTKKDIKILNSKL